MFNKIALRQIGKKHMPYGMVEKGLLTVTGLPDGITLRTPGSYGRHQLERILAAADSIKLTVHKEPQERPQPPVSAATSPPVSSLTDPPVPSPSEVIHHVINAEVHNSSGTSVAVNTTAHTMEATVKSILGPVRESDSEQDDETISVPTPSTASSLETAISIAAVETKKRKSEEEMYEVLDILKTRMRKRRKEYLVQWSCGSKTWQPEEDVDEIKDCVDWTINQHFGKQKSNSCDETIKTKKKKGTKN